MLITFITHSAFAVELEKVVLIFDYYMEGELPSFDTGKAVYFFVSHRHGDHYSPGIFDYRERWAQVTYILSGDVRIEQKRTADISAGRLFRMKKDEELFVDGLYIRTLRSTDVGVAYLVETEGKRIYHAGDLNWWHWEGEDKSRQMQMEHQYKKEMKKIAGEHFTLAFIPVDPRLEDACSLGLLAFMEEADADYIFPMHLWGSYDTAERLKKLPGAAAFASRIQVIEKENQQWRL